MTKTIESSDAVPAYARQFVPCHENPFAGPIGQALQDYASEVMAEDEDYGYVDQRKVFQFLDDRRHEIATLRNVSCVDYSNDDYTDPMSVQELHDSIKNHVPILQNAGRFRKEILDRKSIHRIRDLRDKRKYYFNFTQLRGAPECVGLAELAERLNARQRSELFRDLDRS